MLGIPVHVVNEAAGGPVVLDHKLEVGLIALLVFTHPAVGPALGEHIQNQWVVFIVNVKEIIKFSLSKPRSLGFVNLSPEVEVLDGEEVKKEFIVVFALGQELQDFNLLAVLLQPLDKFLDVIVLLPVLYAEDDADGI